MDPVSGQGYPCFFIGEGPERTPEMLPERYAVTSEDEAFALLERLVAGAVAPHGFEVRLDGWPRFVIASRGGISMGPCRPGSCPSCWNCSGRSIGCTLIRSMDRITCGGCPGRIRKTWSCWCGWRRDPSFFETLLNQPSLQHLTGGGGIDDTSRQVTITVIVFALAATRLDRLENVAEERSKALDLDHDLKMSQLENERMVILARAVQQVPLAGLCRPRGLSLAPEHRR